MRRSTAHFPLAALGISILTAGACSNWDGLYGEECNDGWISPGAECPPPARCGDGEVDPGEACDDGNEANGDGCSSSCLFESGAGGGSGEGGSGFVPLCGNGELDEGEICDDGNTDNDDSCLAGCSRASCGDGFLRKGVERCDDGNSINNDGCSSSCTPCGGVPGTFYNGNTRHCFLQQQQELNYEDAKAACAAQGSHLWTGLSGTEVGIASRRLFDDTEVWMGGQVAGDDITWVTGETTTSSLWVAGEPATDGCVVAFATAAKDDNFRTLDCTETRPFLCENEPARINPTTHRAYRRWFTPLTQPEAIEFCESEGGELVAFETEDERDYVDGYLNREHWVNAQRKVGEGYVWEPAGEPLPEDELSPQADAQAGNDCVYMSQGQLFPAPCDEPRMLVCEFP